MCKKYNHSVRHIDVVNKTQRDGGRWGQMEMGIYRGSRARDGGRLGTWGAEMRKKMGVDGRRVAEEDGSRWGTDTGTDWRTDWRT